MSLVVLGKGVETGQDLTIGDIERRSGLYVLGKPGMGKSALLVNLQLQDIENNHGLFFLDPHREAINNLITRASYARLCDSGRIVDFESEEGEMLSFGINLLSCRNIKSLRERTETYTRAYNVFYKLWEDEFGPWLQLILQNTLWAFIENQDYTLAEVPMFLNYHNKAFRNHIIDNIKYNPAVVDFWRYEFFERIKRDQQERVDAALTRVTTLLTHPYVRHIIGQRKTTIDFAKILEGKQILLVNLSANLAEDIKKFIGTILMSELLHAVRNRLENKRDQFCIVVDEVQNFASSDDFRTLITEARKFGVATTIAHQERYGQFEDNKKLLGATLAAANKVFFQLTVKDAQELAPEFADMADDVKTRVGGDLVISPHAIEDIWEKGHPNKYVMNIREKYFWIVDLLKSRPQEDYYVFDPQKMKTSQGNGGRLNYGSFSDLEAYRSTPDMLKQGISLLNKYYYDCMQNGFKEQLITNEELQLFLRIIECFSGVFGFRPTMEPYIPETMSLIFMQRLKERARRKDEENMELYRRTQDPNYVTHLERSIENIPSGLTLEYVSKWREFAVMNGFSSHEIDQFIQWHFRPLHASEATPLAEIVRIVSNITLDHATYEREQNRLYRAYTSVMAINPMRERFGENHNQLPYEQVEPYLRIVTERIIWQMSELQEFIIHCLRVLPSVLARHQVKIPSAQYDEMPKREKTQAEMIDIMAQELTNLPRFSAYAKVIDESQGVQAVVERRIETYPLQKAGDESYSQKMHSLLWQNTLSAGFYIDRDQIEEEIRQRQAKWRDVSSSDSSKPTDSNEPPEDSPPPTRF